MKHMHYPKHLKLAVDSVKWASTWCSSWFSNY